MESGFHRQFWNPACFSHQLPSGMARRVLVSDLAIVVWRLSTGALRAFYDVCPHRGAPLSAGPSAEDRLHCPYHGWQFDGDGICQVIPGQSPEGDVNGAGSASQSPGPEKNCLRRLHVHEANQVVWVHLGHGQPATFPIASESATRIFFQETFPVHLEDLLENFIDPMHTLFVHDGIIRKKKRRPEQRKVRFESTADHLTLFHPERFDDVGPWQRLINPGRKALRHWERITFPNFLEVHYQFVDSKYRFKAEIALRPESENLSSGPRTTALIALIADFGALSWPARQVIRHFAKKVVQQDKQILDLLASNRWATRNPEVRTYTSLPMERHFDEFRKQMARLRRGETQRPPRSGEFDLFL